MRSKTAYNSTNIGSPGTSFYGKYKAQYIGVTERQTRNDSVDMGE